MWSDSLLILAAMCFGVLAGSLFRWEHPGSGAVASAAGIFVHNLAMAAVCVVFAPYVAYPIVLVSGFGFGLASFAYATFHGLPATVALVASYAPLEFAAWLVVLVTARRVGHLYRKPAPEERDEQFRRLAILITGGTALFAVAAWAEFHASVWAN
ncbi:MAG: hypothetical protein ACOYEV_15425 [Candidatus Nanopelagicales bacterium]